MLKFNFLLLLSVLLFCSVESHYWEHNVDRYTITGMTPIGYGVLNQPESIDFDADGFLYTGLADGSIHKVNVATGVSTLFAYLVDLADRSGCGLLENEVLCGRALGLSFDPTGNGDLIVMDSWNGLKRITPGGIVTTIVDGYQGVKFNFTNSVLMSQDQRTIYFTETSVKWGRSQFVEALLSGVDDGRLFKYDLVTDQLTLIREGYRFANGIEFANNERDILLAETSTRKLFKIDTQTHRQRVIREFDCYPDNIKKSPDGSYLVGCFTEATPWVDLTLQDETLGKLVIDNVPEQEVFANLRVMGIIKRINNHGRLLAEYVDQTGMIIGGIAEAHEYNGKMYIGSVVLPFLAVIDLTTNVVLN